MVRLLSTVVGISLLATIVSACGPQPSPTPPRPNKPVAPADTTAPAGSSGPSASQ